MPLILLFDSTAATPDAPTAFEMTAALTGRVGGFLELSQMLTGRVPLRELVLDTYLTGVVPGYAPAGSAGVLDLVMTAGDATVESFNWSAERGQGSRMDVTVIGDARGGTVPPVSVSAGGYGAAFAAPGTLPEWEYERASDSETTTLHASDRSLIPTTKLPELVPWESQEDKDHKAAVERAERLAKIPVAQRTSARTDWRRIGVDEVVTMALATVPHRLLVAPPFPGYDFRAFGDGPSYSTLGKTAEEVMQDIWGKAGIQSGWEGGVLVIRPPGPTGDVKLAAPIGSERIERITLDAPDIEVEGGVPADTDGEDGVDTDGDGIPDTGGPRIPGDSDGDGIPDLDDPDSPDNSPDPDEQDGNGSSGFAEGISPTPEVEEVAAIAVPLKWEAVPTASQYVVERIEGVQDGWTLWSRMTITTATRWTDDTVLPMHTYSYRLRVNATAYAGTPQNVIWQPSEVVQVTTPPADTEGAPGPVTNLEGYYRDETSVGIKWTPPQADPIDQPPPRKPAADRYDIEVRSQPGGILLKKTVTFQSWAYLDGLPVGAALRVSVASRTGSEAGEAALLDVQLVNLPPAPVGEVKLEAAKDDTATPSSPTPSGTLTASWEAASGAKSYLLYRALAEVGVPEDKLVWTYSQTVLPPTTAQDGDQANTLTHQMGNLAFATRFAVRVRAANELGPGAWSPVAYAVTPDAPPQPEPSPEIASFEAGQSGHITTSRTTDSLAETTTVWKKNGRVEAIESKQSGVVALIERDAPADATPQTVWLPFSVSTTRNYYEIPGWPLTMTATVTETVLFDRSPKNAGQEAGREQERVHQEWNPQGWLFRRTTERSKAAWVIGQEDEDGNIVSRRIGNQREYIVESWLPVGGGLWLYERKGTVTALTPTYIPGPLDDGGQPTPGEWTHLETTTKPLPGETSVTDQAPPQATLPDQKKPEKTASEPPPALPANPSSPALSGYPLDEPWFSTPAPVTGGPNTGPEGGGDGDPDAPASPPMPKGPSDPEPTPEGSGNPAGVPEPDEPPKSKEKEPVKIKTRPGRATGSGGTGSGGNGAVVQVEIPWVRTAAGLARYAAMLAQANGGPRLRITRTYLLPATPPGLDQAVSVSASGSAGQFEMTVVTETR